MTFPAFDPAKHGFHFGNTFKNDFLSALDVTTDGLCNGMRYAALDYYFAKMPVPTQDAASCYRVFRYRK